MFRFCLAHPQICLFQPGNCSYAGETESQEGDNPTVTPRGCLTSWMKLSRLRSLMSLLTAMGMLPNQGTWKLEKESEELGREQKDGPGGLESQQAPKSVPAPHRAGRAPTPKSRDNGGGAGYPG